MSEGEDQTGSGRAARWVHVAWGLIVVGVIGLGAGSLLEVGPTRDGRPLALVILTILSAALVVSLGVVLFVDRLRPKGLPRRIAIAVGIVASVLAVYAWVLVIEDFRGGLMSAALPVTACAATMAGIGGWLLAGSARADGSTSSVSRKQFGAAGIAAAVAAALTVGAGVGLPRLPIDTTTTTAEAGDPIVQKGAPTEVAWTWDSGDSPIADISLAPVPRGVAVRVNDGVVALDAESGEELWHYRVAGAEVTFVEATPDGSWVLLGLKQEERGSYPDQLVALDGRTGEVGFTSSPDRLEAGELIVGRLGDALLSAGTLLTADASAYKGGRILYGLSLSNGAKLWEWRTPKGCRHIPSEFGDEKEAAQDSFLVSFTCSDGRTDDGDERGRVVSVALGADTGEERWTVEQPTGSDDELDGGLMLLTNDKSVVEFDAWDRGSQNSVVVDVASGDVLHRGEGDFLATSGSHGEVGSIWRGDDGRWILRPIDPEKPKRVIPEPDLTCPHNASTVLDSDAIVELCTQTRDGESGPLSVAVAPLDGGPGRLIEVGLDSGEGKWRAGPALVRLPAVTLVVRGDSTELVALR